MSLSNHALKSHRKCWYNIDLDLTDVFREGWTPPSCEGLVSYTVNEYHAKDIIRKSWLHDALLCGLNVHSVLVFTRAPMSKLEKAHIDIRRQTGNKLITVPFAINWVYGGQDNCMIWYEPPVGELKKQKVGKDIEYAPVSIDSLIEIEKHVLSEHPTIVRTNLPHIITHGNTPRVCVSLRTLDSDNIGSDRIWNDTINKLRILGVVEDR